MTPRKILLLAGTILVLAATPRDAAAASTHSFEGSCAIVGYAELDDPMTLVPIQSRFRFRGEGRCMGTLDGVVLPDRGVAVRMTSEGERPVHSCELGVDPGVTWRLTFDLARPQRDVSIHGYGDIVDVLRSQSSVFHGQQGGSAVAVNTIQGHAETLRRCLSEGASEGSVGIQLDTLTPLVSDDRSRRPGRAPSSTRSQPLIRARTIHV